MSARNDPSWSGSKWVKIEDLEVGMWIDLEGDTFAPEEDKEIWEEEYAVIRSIEDGDTDDSLWLTFEDPDMVPTTPHDALMPRSHTVKVVGITDGLMAAPPIIMELV